MLEPLRGPPAAVRGLAPRTAGTSPPASPAPAPTPAAAAPAATPVVDVRGLGKRYGAAWAVRGVTFQVGRGEIFGVIGPNGAGKTTTLKMLAGLVAPTEGAASVLGRAVQDPAHRGRVGYLPEESPLYEDLTPRAYLRFFADLHGVPRAQGRDRIEALLDALQLEVRDEKRIGDLSKGMRRKVAIARSLVHDPAVLVFDEPASGLDPVVSAYILELLGRLRREGRTVLLSAHNLYHLERVCDRVLILRRGGTVALGTMREIRDAVGGTEFLVRLSVPLDGARPARDGGEGFELAAADMAAVAELERAAKARGGRVLGVAPRDLSLEEIFLRQAAR